MKKFFIDCFFATAFVFLVLIGVQKITSLAIFNALDPISQALSDVELTDYAFSKLRIEETLPDTNIVIVNTSTLSRAQVAQQISVISQGKPKVIALDIIFSCDRGIDDSVNCPQRYDTLANLMLADAIQNAGTVVMAHKLWQSKKIADQNVPFYDSIEYTDADLRGNAVEGYVNLPTGAGDQEELKICRTVIPTMDVKGKTEVAFSVKIAQQFNKARADQFLARDFQEDIINFFGNGIDPFGASTSSGRFSIVEWDQAMDPEAVEPSFFKDKIVIMGFMGQDLLTDRSWEDKFFTPLNQVIAGRARPDMYGVVIHANIVHMILSGQFIDQLETYQQILIAIILCFANVALFWFIQRKFPIWFDTITLALQLVQIAMFLLLVPYVMHWFNFKLDITIALAALALVGPCFEIYMNILRGALKAFKKRLITKRRKQVYTS